MLELQMLAMKEVRQEYAFTLLIKKQVSVLTDCFYFPPLKYTSLSAMATKIVSFTA
jgi:hypothetical protein